MVRICNSVLNSAGPNGMVGLYLAWSNGFDAAAFMDSDMISSYADDGPR